MCPRKIRIVACLVLFCLFFIGCDKQAEEKSLNNNLANTLKIHSEDEKFIKKAFMVNDTSSCEVIIKRMPNNNIVNVGGGYKYYDNTAEVRITYNDKEIFNKTIRKADFKDRVIADFYKQAVLFDINIDSCTAKEVQIGFNLLVMDTDWLYEYVYHIPYDSAAYIEEIPYEDPGDDDLSHEPQAEEEKFDEKVFIVRNSNKCVVTIKRMSNSEIVYGDGDYQYYDNTAEIKVAYNDKEIFYKSLRKADLKDRVDPDFYKNAVLYHINFESYTDDEIKIRFYLSQHGSDWHYGYMYHIRYDGSSYIEELPYEEPGAEKEI